MNNKKESQVHALQLLMLLPVAALLLLSFRKQIKEHYWKPCLAQMTHDEDPNRFEATCGEILAPTPPVTQATTTALNNKKLNQEISVFSDSLSYNASTKRLFFSIAQEKWNNETNMMDRVFPNIESLGTMVLINGEDFTGNRNYTAPKGSVIKVKNLDKKDAFKKYGERGKNGAIEIQVIKKNTPVIFFNPRGPFSIGTEDGC
ncbi:MAG: hypothetical protein WD135_05475 [Ferruginibacter sp.]